MKRYLSIDIFRGITVALMILVNCMDDENSYRWLLHSPWNGCTLADLVFPFFVLIVGVSAAFSITHLRNKHIERSQILVKIIKRTAFLFLIGLLINAFPNHFDLSTIRIFGVLQRIAICYFFASILFLTTKLRTQAIVLVALLIGYWLAMKFIPVPGFGAFQLTLDGNLAAYIDKLIIPASHLYRKTFDPEGLFSTLPAIATALCGNFVAVWLLSLRSEKAHFSGMVFAGIIAMTVGWLWGLTFPINKTLWTSSYVLWTAGIGILLFAACYFLVEIMKWRAWAKPFELFGINAMTAFTLHVLYLKMEARIPLLDQDGQVTHLNQLVTKHLAPTVSPHNASFLFGIFFVGFWLLVITLLQLYPRFLGFAIVRHRKG